MRKRLLVPLLSLVALAAVEPAAAADSVTEELISGLNGRLLAIAVPVTLLVEAILAYTVWRFKDNDEARPTRENRRLEVVWTVTTAIILLFVGVASYGVMANPNVVATQDTVQDTIADENPVVVEVTGVQWYWQFEYPNQNVSTRGELVLPTDRPVVLKITADTVIHSVHVPELGLKADAFPGRTTYLQTRIFETGQYQLYCAEFCGAGHSKMLADVTVKSPAEYQDWLDQQQNESG